MDLRILNEAAPASLGGQRHSIKRRSSLGHHHVFGAALLGFFGDLLLGRVFLDIGAVLAIAFVGSRIVYFLYEQQNQDEDKDDSAP